MAPSGCGEVGSQQGEEEAIEPVRLRGEFPLPTPNLTVGTPPDHPDQACPFGKCRVDGRRC